MDQSHLIREFEQISLIQKKIDAMISKGPKAEHIPQILDSLDNTHRFTVKVVDGISSNKIRMTDDLITAINHELRTPLVPIRAYADMLLRGDFGALNEEQQRRISLLVSSAKQLQQKIESLLDRDSIHGSDSGQDTEHQMRETEQEKILLKKINSMLDRKIEDGSSEIKKLKKELKEVEFERKETEQKNKLLAKSAEAEELKGVRLARKNVIIIAIAALAVGSVLTISSVYTTALVGQQYQVPGLGTSSGGYVVQNLRGDTIDTWLSWRLVQGSTIHVGITNGDEFPEKIPLIREVVESEEVIEIDDSLLHKGPKGSTSKYYVGWQGALKQAAAQDTEFYIPTSLAVIESSRGEGEITIILAGERSGDGFAGFTKSIADDSQNQILKSTITIYDVSRLGDEQFKAILRHEMGHALGLAHSTAPEDLMAPTITTQYPYISDCMINSIVSLYDGGKNSQVTCEK